MSDHAAVDYLLAHAGPSIRYRLRREVLAEPPDSADRAALQQEILRDARVQAQLALRQPDGWLGGAFHGWNEPESAVRYLTELGVEGSHPVIQGALEALTARGDRFDDGSLARVGKWLDAAGVGGSRMILACVFAYAGVEDAPVVAEQIPEALMGFAFAAGVGSMEEVCRPHRDGKLVFRDGVRWPSIYHLRLLALTHSWRTGENLAAVAAAVERLATLSPIPPIKLLHGSQIVSPASVYMNDFAPDPRQLTSAEWMQWFHRTELLARLGIAGRSPTVARQLQWLRGELAAHEGLFTRPLSHPYFTKWSQYMGLALEPDWKRRVARVCDLTFRSVLILHHGAR